MSDSNKRFPDKKGRSSSEKPCYATSPVFTEPDLSTVREFTDQADYTEVDIDPDYSV
ncbi:MAG: hypothetical protein E6Q55_04585 [Mycolicibacterium mageritense]|nr:MAG: hypothetical protein E6Q55_04585 [Mycolicibacterium mageritense]